MTKQPDHILVLGGYGLIGSAVVRALIEDGFRVTALGRDIKQGQSILPLANWIAADISRLKRPSDWTDILEGVDTVVNASGALQSGLKDKLSDLQATSISALIAECEAAGVKRFVQISAPGATTSASTEFLRTKAVADQRLRESSLEWHILKPGLVVSNDAYGGTALLRMLAAFPLVIPVVKAHSPVGTVDIDDVTIAVSRACSGLLDAGSEMDIVERIPHSLAEVLFMFRRWLGFDTPMAIVKLPDLVASATSRVADFLGRLGWRSPLRSTAVRAIDEGVVGDPSEFERQIGRNPKTLEETLNSLPSTVQERWFSRMYLAHPIILGTLSLFWLASGLIGAAMWEEAITHLTKAGMTADQARTIVFAGAAADIALGAAVLFRPLTRLACLGMVAVTAGYLGAGTILSPELWADPIGPYVKTIPAAVLALVGAALTRTR